jgi:UDP-N-acetylglucosamine 2-epimerase (non-hydrolysing)
MSKLILVTGARPNFMKVAPILRALRAHPAIAPVLVHTGQHYDDAMAGSFFRDLGMSEPAHDLEVGSGSHAAQTAAIMERFERVCLAEKPRGVLVVGDVNSTIAAGLVAKKLGLVLAHVEAGLRSGDRAMPEEINRLATDAISDLFFVTEQSAADNLAAEGHASQRVHMVGHVMIDNLLFQLDELKRARPARGAELRSRLPGRFCCLTLHRPATVDDPHALRRVLQAVATLAAEAPVLFACHPRTAAAIKREGLDALCTGLDTAPSSITQGIVLTPPLGYNDFLYLWKDAVVVLTDSGGLQEETTALGKPCITLRENTERPVTVTLGTNELAGRDPDAIIALGRQALAGRWKRGSVPPLWDGRAGERIAAVVARELAA